jgi:DNA-binding MarR family transcriptional regulator
MYELAYPLHRLMRQERDALLEGTPLSSPAADVLFCLWKMGDSGVKRIADIMNVTSPACTQATETLERQGYVTRATDEVDKRVTIVSLTPAGRALVEELRMKVTMRTAEHFVDLSDADLNAHLETTMKMITSLKRNQI